MASLKKAVMRRSWENAWLKKDFSWDGLASKRPPEGAQAENYQAFLRLISGGGADEKLERLGLLVRCNKGALYHILYIPPHWKSKYINDDEAFLKRRSEIFKNYRASVQNLANSTAYGISFYKDDKIDIVEQLSRFNYCFIGSGADILSKKNNVFLRQVFVDGSLSHSQDFTNHLILDIGASYICGSVNPRVSDSFWLDLTIKQSRISEALKDSECKIRCVHLSHSTIGGVSLFECNVLGRCAISNASVPGGLTFDSSDFEGQVSISETDISSFARFIDCDFNDRVVFRDVQWSVGMVTSAFTTGSRFKELVTFTSRETPPIQLFDGGEFEANVGFDSRYHGRWGEAFLDELKSQDFDQEKSAILASKLEAASRNLRNLAQARGDASTEHFWHRAEIIARRRTSSVHGLEEIASHAYGWLADYGLSIGRPFIWLLGMIIVLGVVYAYAGGTSWAGALDLSSLEQGVGFSLHQSFPVGVFDDPDEKWSDALLGRDFSFAKLGIRILATSQTILSAILIYLGIMAIRRKFKIG